MLKSILPVLVLPVLLPTLTGLFAICIALAPVLMIGLTVLGLILKARE